MRIIDSHANPRDWGAAALGLPALCWMCKRPGQPQRCQHSPSTCPPAPAHWMQEHPDLYPLIQRRFKEEGDVEAAQVGKAKGRARVCGHTGPLAGG